MLHFCSLMNDYHLQDLSSKIKSTLHSKKTSEQDTTAYMPYDYRRSSKIRAIKEANLFYPTNLLYLKIVIFGSCHQHL